MRVFIVGANAQPIVPMVKTPTARREEARRPMMLQRRPYRGVKQQTLRRYWRAEEEKVRRGRGLSEIEFERQAMKALLDSTHCSSEPTSDVRCVEVGS